ncbi:hypothetical protein NM688_g3361 [Phlebia brevispora]|uniref:Uncharacterized protein n=1 Tax=Phlebia brevispora TaxID=194682 RepID=A0ACC1T5T8_9APHY|nr:hypothetical protein NM688_g3361 [Phlebia brevispora]
MPLELVILVLGHLRDDKAALTKCSQICRSWVPLAYQHLFRVITVKKSHIGLRHAMDKLLTRLRIAPYLKSYIQELTLTGDELAPAYHQMLYAHDLVMLLGELSALRVFRISHAYIACAPLCDSWALPKCNKKLAKLVVSSLTAPTGSLTLAQVIGLFSWIQELRLENFAGHPLNHAFFHSKENGAGIMAKDSARPCVNSVVIKNCCPSIAGVALWSLRTLGGISSLKGMSLHSLDLETLTILDDLIHSSNLSLHNLELNLLRLPLSWDMHELQYEFNIPAISSHASLESLHFTMMIWMHDIHAAKARILWRSFATLLLDVAQTIREVHITLHTAELRTISVAPTTQLMGLSRLSLLEWSLLDRAISQSPLLESVVVKVVNGDPDSRESSAWLGDEVQDLLRSRLSRRAITTVHVVKTKVQH